MAKRGILWEGLYERMVKGNRQTVERRGARANLFKIKTLLAQREGENSSGAGTRAQPHVRLRK